MTSKLTARKLRLLYKLCQALAAVILLVSCTGGPRTDTSDTAVADPVDLTVWLWPGNGYESLINRYQEEHPNVTVDVIRFDFQDLHNNLQTAFAAGYGAPDISLIDTSYIERFKRLPDYFHNLAELSDEPLEAEFLSWKWRQAVNHDQSFVYGLPTDIGPIVIAFRPELYRQAGLPIDRDGIEVTLRDWDAFLEAGIQLKERTGKPMIDNISSMYRVILGQSERQYFDEETGGFIGHTNPAVREAWDYAVRAKEEGLSANMTPTSAVWADGLENGDFATLLAPSWMLGNVTANAPGAMKEWDLAKLPGPAGNLGGAFLTIPKESDNPQEAFTLIRWLTSRENQLHLFNEYHMFPAMPSLLTSTDIQYKHDDFFRGAPVGRLLADSAADGRYVYEGPYQFIVNDTMDVALTNVEDGMMEAERAWQEAMAEIKETLTAKNLVFPKGGSAGADSAR